MLKEQAKKYIESELQYGAQRELYHYNCAEVLLNSCNDYYKLGLDDKTQRAIVPFGGGLYSEKTCGMLTGGIAVLGVMFTEEKPTSNAKLKEITQKWVKTFEEEFGDTNCKAIKEAKRDKEKGCALLIEGAAQIFENTIKEYLHE